MNNADHDSLALLCSKLETQGVKTRLIVPSPLPPAQLLEIDSTSWGKAAETAQAGHSRWAGVWAEDLTQNSEFAPALNITAYT